MKDKITCKYEGPMPDGKPICMTIDEANKAFGWNLTPYFLTIDPLKIDDSEMVTVHVYKPVSPYTGECPVFKTEKE